MKKSFGLSMSAWLHRAHDLGITNDQTNSKRVQYFRNYGWHKQEPCDEFPKEESQVFMQMFFHALGEELISESKAAELMAMPLIKFRQLRKVDNA